MRTSWWGRVRLSSSFEKKVPIGASATRAWHQNARQLNSKCEFPLNFHVLNWVVQRSEVVDIIVKLLGFIFIMVWGADFFPCLVFIPILCHRFILGSYTKLESLLISEQSGAPSLVKILCSGGTLLCWHDYNWTLGCNLLSITIDNQLGYSWQLLICDDRDVVSLS